MSTEFLERMPYAGAGSRSNVAGGGGGGGSTLPELATRWSEDVMNSLGLNAHLNYGGYIDQQKGSYASVAAAFVDKFTYIGARTIRDKIYPGNANQHAVLPALYAAGVTTMFCSGELDQSPPTAAAFVNEIKTYPTGMVSEATGHNEPDQTGVSTWGPDSAAYMTTLFPAINAMGRGIQVLSPPLAFMSKKTTLGVIGANCHGVDLHGYPGGQKPSLIGQAAPNTSLSGLMASGAYTAPGKPFYLSECGYEHAVATAGGNKPVTEAVAKVYAPLELLEGMRLGIKKIIFYEYGDGLRNDALDSQPKHWGWVAWDAFAVPSLRNKPQADAMHNLTQLCLDPGTAPVLVNLRGTISDASVHYLVLGKRDGSYLLCLWRDVSIWNPPATTPYASPYTAGNVTVGATNCTVDFGTSKTIEVYKPSTGSARVGSATVATSTVVSLAGELVVLKIT